MKNFPLIVLVLLCHCSCVPNVPKILNSMDVHSGVEFYFPMGMLYSDITDLMAVNLFKDSTVMFSYITVVNTNRIKCRPGDCD